MELRHHSAGKAQGDRALRVHAGVQQNGGGVHLLDFISQHHERKVYGVDPYIRQCAAAQLRPEQTLLVGMRVAQVGGEGVYFAHHAPVQQPPESGGKGHVAGPNGLGEQQAAFFRQGEQLLCLGGGRGEGFFA